MKAHSVNGGNGVNLHVREWGTPSGIPILLIHGWSQNHLCWSKQYESSMMRKCRIVAFDLRGHGMSDAPLDADHYTDGDKWAADVAAVIDQLSLEKPILVGWSYGGLVICDYVRKHGDARVGGINFVAAAVALGPSAFGSLIGPGFLEHAPPTFESDVPGAIVAMRKFLRACFIKSVSADDFEVTLAFNMIVQPKVRGFLVQRELDFAPVLKRVTVPVLVTHGRQDTVVLPAMSDYILVNCKAARSSWFEDVGHGPFLEAPDRALTRKLDVTVEDRGRTSLLPYEAGGTNGRVVCQARFTEVACLAWSRRWHGDPWFRDRRASRLLFSVDRNEVSDDLCLVLLGHLRTECLHHLRHFGLPALLVEKDGVHLDVVEAVA
jgi:pimeloyl-ACP methyl ester carboxylesterase